MLNNPASKVTAGLLPCRDQHCFPGIIPSFGLKFRGRKIKPDFFIKCVDKQELIAYNNDTNNSR
jgi:hypothetical protein